MGKGTIIAWTTATANFWMGCLKVSPGCKNCYAETLTRSRMGLDLWGPAGRTRRQEVRSVYANLRKLQREARAGLLTGPEGLPPLVFVGSLMDWAEDHPDADALRPGIWSMVRECDALHFQLLTKRAERIGEILPDDWHDFSNGYPNVWLGVSVESADYAWRADELAKIPAVVRFVSYEPALGPLHEAIDLSGVDWVIYGGESGPGYRAEGEPGDPQAWTRAMRDKCEAKMVAYFHKQSAAPRTEMGVNLDGATVRSYPKPRRSERRLEHRLF